MLVALWMRAVTTDRNGCVALRAVYGPFPADSSAIALAKAEGGLSLGVYAEVTGGRNATLPLYILGPFTALSPPQAGLASAFTPR